MDQAYIYTASFYARRSFRKALETMDVRYIESWHLLYSSFAFYANYSDMHLIDAMFDPEIE